MQGPTYASVTSEACTCGYLQQSAANPDNPIKFDARLNEYSVSYQTLDGGRGALSIYHCLFCGGTAPPSRRHLLFATVTPEEADRIQSALAHITTVEQAVRELGPPDEDDPRGLGRGLPNTPDVSWYRVLTYERLSAVANVYFTVESDGHLSLTFQGKYIGSDREA